MSCFFPSWTGLQWSFVLNSFICFDGVGLLVFFFHFFCFRKGSDSNPTSESELEENKKMSLLESGLFSSWTDEMQSKLGFLFSWTDVMCLSKSSFKENEALHVLQMNCFFPSWTGLQWPLVLNNLICFDGLKLLVFFFRFFVLAKGLILILHQNQSLRVV